MCEYKSIKMTYNTISHILFSISRVMAIVTENLAPTLMVLLSLFQEDGGIEYFNTIVVQPHLKLITNQGRGFHVRCRYQTRDKVVSNDQTHVSMMQSLPLQVIKRLAI